MTMRWMIGPLLMMTANGCAAVPPAEGDVPAPGDSARVCRAESAQHLVGRPASQELGAEAMRLSGAGALRWIPHDGVVTMDFRTDRLNIELDRVNKVVAIRCG
jgi:hypothetical protein